MVKLELTDSAWLVSILFLTFMLKCNRYFSPLPWTHIGPFCVHSYMHAEIHLAFWVFARVCVCMFACALWSRFSCMVVLNVYFYCVLIRIAVNAAIHFVWSVALFWIHAASRLSVRMPYSVLNRLFLFQTRLLRTGRAKMRCYGGATVTKR